MTTPLFRQLDDLVCVRGNADWRLSWGRSRFEMATTSRSNRFEPRRQGLCEEIRCQKIWLVTRDGCLLMLDRRPPGVFDRLIRRGRTPILVVKQNDEDANPWAMSA
jgi:hypothetical protein